MGSILALLIAETILNAMRLVKILFLFLAVGASVAATTDSRPNAAEPSKITWENLKDVKFQKKWYPEEKMYILYPSFGPGVQKLSNKEVIIKGYLVPVDITTNTFVLSAYPNSMCFFCTGTGPETIMALKMKNPRRFKVDEVQTFKGTLKLNSNDIYELNYILDNAEVIQAD
ncbi:MAG: DUF3299 domain-containing protein [Siphonobacter sp.]